MIYLAIDEMQNAECRMQNEAGANDSCRPPYSAFCILHSAFRQEQLQREDEEERLKQSHLQAGDE